MHAQAVTLMLAAVAILVPLAQAETTAVDTAAPAAPVVGALDAVDDTLSVAGVADALPSPAVDVAPSLTDPVVSVGVQAHAEADAPTDAQPGAGARADVRSASLADRVVDAAAPAAVPVAAVTLVGLLAFGGAALQAWLGRAGSWLARGARALAGLVGVRLFSRIERSRLLDNPVRACLHEAIAQEPGLSLTELSQRAGVAWGTTVHHLRRLEANDLIVSKHLGQRRYFIANSPAAAQRSAVAVVMHPTARRIAHLVSQQPGIDQTGICATLHLNNPAASKHLGHFEEQGLVLSVRSGRSRTYHPTGGLHSALRLVEAHPAPASAAAHPLLVAPQVGAW